MKNCAIENCTERMLAKGLCRKHYLRRYRHGNTDVVKKPSEYVPKGIDSPNYKHGLWQHPLYKTWRNMISRCSNKKDAAYKNYGARGIDVCDRWLNIKNFIDDMGERPIGKSLDRIDNSKGYSPNNCKWSSDLEQVRNRRITKMTYDKAQSIRQERLIGVKRKALAEKYGVSEATVKKIISNEYWIAPTIAGTMKRG